MTVGAGGGRVISLVLFALATAIGSEALAAPRAAELGPEAVLAEPSGGFVGRLSVKPEHGPVGTPLEVTGDGFPAEQEIELVWRTVKGRWKVTISEYHGSVRKTCGPTVRRAGAASHAQLATAGINCQ